jgi:hypothetical protein
MKAIGDVARPLGAALVDPRAALGGVAERPRPWALLAGLAAALVALGLATLPRQLALLDNAMAATGDPLLDAQTELLRSAVLRLIVVDRLVASPTLIVAALLLAIAAEPVLMLAQRQRPAIWAVVLLGLTPLVVLRVGELAITYVAAIADPVAGDAVTAPQRFVTGPLLLWWGEGPAPGWLEVLSRRVNLIVLWCLALWSMGMRQLDGGGWQLWHWALPAVCVAAAGLITWMLGPVVLPLVLGAG